VTALTSVALDHTEWLGPDEISIAREKLAVLRHGSVLVLGNVSPAVAAEAEAHAGRMGARIVRAPEDPGPEVGLRALGAHQRRNFAVARAAAEAALGPLGDDVARRVAETLEVPARLELIADDPMTYIDAAHNAQGMEALAASLPQIAEGRPAVGCVAVMADKDAPAMMAALAPALARAVVTEPPLERAAMARPGAKAHPAAELARMLGDAGLEADVEGDPAAALRRARELAREAGGVVIAAGSHYLLEVVRAASVKRS
jgi:dihydrofolate synthase/folylpolyglutamate synthase